MQQTTLGEDTVTCIECGAAVEAGFGRTFARGDGTFLCFECAVRRGGVWDELHDTWRAEPNEEGLADARAPHP